jgi:four helix bundle protein
MQMTTLKIYSDAIALVRVLRPAVEIVSKHDSDLGRQLRRALTSIPLNIAEGAKLNDGNGRARFLTAMGSTNEVTAVLETSEALGYLDAVEAGVLDELDRIARTLNRLARPRR